MEGRENREKGGRKGGMKRGGAAQQQAKIVVADIQDGIIST